MLALLLLLSTGHPLPRPVQVHDLPTLTDATALRLAGKGALYRVEADSLPGEVEGRVGIDCASPDAVHRTVRLLPGCGELPETFTVRARLRVIRHPPNWGVPQAGRVSARGCGGEVGP